MEERGREGWERGGGRDGRGEGGMSEGREGWKRGGGWGGREGREGWEMERGEEKDNIKA